MGVTRTIIMKEANVMNVVKEISVDTYDDLFAQTDLTPLQSSAWGKSRGNTWKSKYFTIDDIPVLVLLRKIPFMNKYFAYVPWGFSDAVIDKIGKDMFAQGLKALSDELFQKYGVEYLIVDPYVTKEHLNISEQGKKNQLQPQYTNILKLDGDIDQLFKNFKRSHRANIRKAKRAGLHVKVFTRDNCTGEEACSHVLDELYAVLKSVALRTDYVIRPKLYYSNVLRNLLQSDNGAVLSIYSSQDELLASGLISIAKSRVVELYGGATDAGLKNFAAYLLKYEQIKFSLEQGKEFYDHFGIAPFTIVTREDGVHYEYAKDHHLYGISSFKEGFGGLPVRLLPQIVFANGSRGKFIYSVGNWAQKLAVSIAKIRKGSH